MLLIKVPDELLAARSYVINWLFVELFQQDIVISVWHHDFVEIECEGKTLRFDDAFFQRARLEWLETDLLPTHFVVRKWSEIGLDLPLSSGVGLPVLFTSSSEEPVFSRSSNGGFVNVDVFGTIFFLITRYEEACAVERDRWGRFPIQLSHAYRNGYLDRPLGNEYIELLWECLVAIWPSINRPSRSYRLLLSHDVDDPLYSIVANFPRFFKSVAADLLQRREPKLAVKRTLAVTGAKFGLNCPDPFDTYDWIIDRGEELGLQSSFFFICSDPSYDANNVYSIRAPNVKHILKKVLDRGHLVGLHPSLFSQKSPRVICRELNELSSSIEECGHKFSGKGGRHHYLCWEPRETWSHWDCLGFEYDSTVGFPEQPSFRAGVCFEYPTFDLVNQRTLHLRERPLVCMERCILDRSDSGAEEKIASFVELGRSVKRFHGDMTLLWHQNRLASDQERRIYLESVRQLC